MFPSDIKITEVSVVETEEVVEGWVFRYRFDQREVYILVENQDVRIIVNIKHIAEGMHI